VVSLIEIEQSPAELFIIWQILAPITSRCDLYLWPLELEHGRWRVMCSIYVTNLSEIGPATAELLTINRFFVRFQGVLQYCGSCFKNAWTDLHQTL